MLAQGNAVLLLAIIFFTFCAYQLSKQRHYFVALLPGAMAWILLWDDFPVSHKIVAFIRSVLGLSGPLIPLFGSLLFLFIVLYALKLMLVGDKNV